MLKIQQLSNTPKYVIQTNSFLRIEYNHQKTTEFLTILAFLNSVKHAGYYLGFETSTITEKGFIDGLANGLTFGTYGDVKNIIQTDYFIAVFTGSGNLINTGNKLGIIDTGTIAGDGKIDYVLITNQVVPTAGLNGAYPIFVERIDPGRSIWIIGGGSDNQATADQEAFGGWYRILQFNEPYGPKCHLDCITCINEGTIDPVNCLTCSDGTSILGPSGCKCSANCLSCSENDNPQNVNFVLKDIT